MVLRHSVECSTCQSSLTLRISIGGALEQKHKFNCPNCNDVIGIILDLDRNSADYGTQKYINCKYSTVEGTIINLNPNFLIPKEDLHRDQAFPQLKQISELGRRYSSRGIKPTYDLTMKEISTIWQELKPIWLLLNNNKYDLLKNKLGLDQSLSDLEVDLIVFDKINKFFMAIFFDLENTPLSDDFYDFMKSTINFTEQSSSDFVSYIYKKLKNEDLKKIYNLFETFFHAYSDFSQVHYSLRMKLEIEAEFTPSSTAVDDTKKIYSDCFELIGNELLTLSQIINLHEKRHFNLFSEKKWTNYKNQHKKYLLDYVKKYPVLSKIEPLLNNKIRNAGFHQSIEWDNDRKVFVCSDRENNFDVSYLDYLILCLNSVNYLVAITNLKMTLVYARNQQSKK